MLTYTYLHVVLDECHPSLSDYLHLNTMELLAIHKILQILPHCISPQLRSKLSATIFYQNLLTTSKLLVHIYKTTIK